ncbi:MAG TPA: ferritin-like domain-containing protein [Gemmataceae bacterium]
MQSNLRNGEIAAQPPPRLPDGPRLLTSAEWVAYFRANLARCRPIPWERGAEVTPGELAAIARSLRGWQLGETSDGNHLRAAAARYARRAGDPDFPAAAELFIREEQRHGELLGRFLDLTGVGRAKADWGDRLFRAARYCVRDMEAWTTPVVIVETLALVYYNAIRRATGSALLRAVCAQILADEVPHLRFQCERLAAIYRGRSRAAFGLTMVAQRLFFLFVLVLVWAWHRKALRAGGYGWRRYRRAAWDRMRASWRRMDPRRYDWPPRG